MFLGTAGPWLDLSYIQSPHSPTHIAFDVEEEARELRRGVQLGNNPYQETAFLPYIWNAWAFQSREAL